MECILFTDLFYFPDELICPKKAKGIFEMNKKIVSITIVALFLLSSLVVIGGEDDNIEGAVYSGNWNDVSVAKEPIASSTTYYISTPEQLGYMATLSVYKDVVLLNDIDLEGRYWVPIGTLVAFDKNFDGRGHTISNMRIEGSTDLGLFASVLGTIGVSVTISNVSIVDSTITYYHTSNYSYCGFVAGRVGYTTIDNCFSTGSMIVDERSMGGIAGFAENSTIRNCGSEAKMIGIPDFFNNPNAGGIVGLILDGEIENCYFAGSASGYYAAGIACNSSRTTIENCYNVGTLSGTTFGGIVARGNAGEFITIIGCYNASLLPGSGSKGGIVGTNYDELSVSNSYSIKIAGGVENPGGSYIDDIENMRGALAIQNMGGLDEDQWVFDKTVIVISPKTGLMMSLSNSLPQLITFAEHEDVNLRAASAISASEAIDIDKIQGPPGEPGTPGTNGIDGTNGEKGDKGDVGPTGPDGAAGATGQTGATGPMGPSGDNGSTGATGPAGPAGETGEIGATGPAGPPGSVGATGPKGDKGIDGDTSTIIIGAILGLIAGAGAAILVGFLRRP